MCGENGCMRFGDGRDVCITRSAFTRANVADLSRWGWVTLRLSGREDVSTRVDQIRLHSGYMAPRKQKAQSQ
ncbi:hypothetical protein HDG34_007739 [Paraburkholderia sp. HC6.4b]|nr:hypothetical protein [Paraburkholderia sp. HC6.4b]MBB5456138.1 hypothetical protein [Paraburkholderia sp. Kb1A]